MPKSVGPSLAYGLGTKVHISKLSTLDIKCWALLVGTIPFQSLFQTESVLAAVTGDSQLER